MSAPHRAYMVPLEVNVVMLAADKRHAQVSAVQSLRAALEPIADRQREVDGVLAATISLRAPIQEDRS